MPDPVVPADSQTQFALDGGAPVVAAAPVVAEVAPVVETAPVAPVVVEAAPVVEAKPAETEGKLVTDVPSLLETVDKPVEEVKPVDGEKKPEVEVKPVEEKKPEEIKPAEEKPAEAKVEEPPKADPVEYKYTLPESVKLDDAMKGELHGLLDEFRINPGENVQKLVDFHVKTMETFAADYAQQLSRQQHEVFNNTRKGWQTELMADEVMGGNGWETTKKRVAEVRDMLISSAPKGSEQYKREWAQANDFLRITGAGDHPAMWRMLSNAARIMLEARTAPAEIKPPPTNGRAPGKRTAILYDKTNFDR